MCRNNKKQTNEQQNEIQNAYYNCIHISAMYTYIHIYKIKCIYVWIDGWMVECINGDELQYQNGNEERAHRKKEEHKNPKRFHKYPELKKLSNITAVFRQDKS